MGQNAAIVLADSAAANKTFAMEVPGNPAGYYSWAEKTSAIYSQFIRIWTKVSTASAQRKTNRLDFGVVKPVVRTVNSVATVTDNIRITVSAVYPADATQTEINDAYAFAKNGMAHALIQGQMRDLDFIS